MRSHGRTSPRLGPTSPPAGPPHPPRMVRAAAALAGASGGQQVSRGAALGGCGRGGAGPTRGQVAARMR
eukprot:8133537-Pyramimonas_sp.AAC.1